VVRSSSLKSYGVNILTPQLFKEVVMWIFSQHNILKGFGVPRTANVQILLLLLEY